MYGITAGSREKVVAAHKSKPSCAGSEFPTLPSFERSGWSRDRTGDTRIFSPLLYQLSYPARPPAAGMRRKFSMPTLTGAASLNLQIVPVKKKRRPARGRTALLWKPTRLIWSAPTQSSAESGSRSCRDRPGNSDDDLRGNPCSRYSQSYGARGSRRHDWPRRS